MKHFLLVLSISFSVVAGIVQSGYALPAPDDVCINTLTPPTNARGVNRVSRNSDAPLYRLHFNENIASDGGRHVGPEAYHVHVSIANELLAFDSAKVQVSAQGSCGTGSLKFDQLDFIEVRQKEDRCPRLLHTAKKRPMTELPSLLWTPPSCGCVVFKVLVVEEANIYFADNEETRNGPLTWTVCVEKRVTREHFLEALCMAPDRHRSSQILSNQAFLTRHRLDSQTLNRYSVEMALELRRSDNKVCCNKPKHKDKMTCFDNVRRHRIDRFCGDGIPDLNFVTFRSSFMREREQQCCFILGEHRYQCFGANSDLKSGTNDTYLDYSLDDTDPANDLAIFVFPKDLDVLQVIKSVNFGGKHNTENSTDISGKRGIKKTSAEDVRKAHGLTPEISKTDDESVSPDVASVAPLSSRERKEKPKQAESKRRDTRPGDLHASSAAVQRVSSAEQRRSNRRRGGSAAETKKASQEMADSTKKSGRQRRNSREEVAGLGGLSGNRKIAPRSSSEKRMTARTSAERAITDTFGDKDLDEDLEDQGGSSIEGQLLKYKKQILRLRLKTVCCKAGASAGKFVYSRTSLRARNECGHSGEKYLSRNHQDTGMKICRDQFMLCCTEKAVSGPSMTSNEFRASPFMLFDNQGRTEVEEDDLEDDHQETPVENENDHDQEELYGQTPDVEGTAKERESQTMRPDNETQVTTPDEELDGPRQFDEMDNAEESVDVLDRSEPAPEKQKLRSRGDEEVDAYDERDFSATIDDKTDDDIEDGLHRRKGHTSLKNKAFKDRETKKESRERTGSVKPGLVEVRGSKNDRRGSQVGGSTRTRGGSSRSSRQRSSRERASEELPPGRNSRSSRQRSSRERASEELPPVYSMYKPRAHIRDRHMGAMDSKEMAAAHGRTYTGTLDSKEMVEAFGKQEILAPARSGTKKKRRHLRQMI
ncbi:unnamed protein product [Lymnaea stagnalis]|uniref:Uncharacterized protein n=1 Tax=Lymnaea stagnalis TaxID=6523 RepID=A0AAV2HUW3_LYMST